MAPRLVYCMIELPLEHKFVDEYDISIRQLRTLFTYWCHVYWLRFRHDNLSHRNLKYMLQSKLNHTLEIVAAQPDLLFDPLLPLDGRPTRVVLGATTS